MNSESRSTAQSRPPCHRLSMRSKSGPYLGAYSTKTGKWDVVDLHEETKSSMTVSANMITLITNKGIYVLDDAKGKWEITDLSDDKPEK